RFHTALHQVIRNRDMHTGPVAVSEQHRGRPLVTRPERIYQHPDPVAVVQIALTDVPLDVTNAFHVARCTLPAGPAQLFNLLLELAVFLQQRFDPLDQVFRLCLEHARRLRELLLEPADQGVGAQPRHRLDAAYAGGRTGLVREPKQRDLARGRDVRPAAQLERDSRYVHHADDVAVFLCEERHRARRDRFLVLHLTRLDREVFPYVRVHLFLDARQGRVVDRPVVSEVEPQPVRGDHGPLLAHVRPEDLAQRGVHQMRRRVVALDVLAPPLVHLRQDGGRLERVLETTDDGAPAVHLFHAGNVELPPFPLHPSRVTDLPARFYVERVLLEHHVDPVVRLPKLEHVGLALCGLVPDPFLLLLGLHGAPLAGLLHVHRWRVHRQVTLDTRMTARRAVQTRPLALLRQR